MSNPSPLADADDRRRAVLTHSHAFVWAGAGTGKTHTLTLRALYLLLNAPFLGSPEESLIDIYRSPDREKRMRAARRIVRSLVLTTFTRKAAAEMQTRLYGYLERLTRLDDVSSLDDPLLEEVVSALLENLRSNRLDEAQQRLRRGAAVLAELAADLQVSTLHSFAASILRRHPLLAGIPPQARFAREDESDLAGLPRQLVERWWTRQALSEQEIESDLSKVLEVVPLEQINRWLEAALEHPGLAARAERETQAAEPLQNAWDACRALIAALGKQGSKGAAGVWKEFARLIEQAQDKQQAALIELYRFLAHHPRLFLNRDPYAALIEALPYLKEGQRAYFESPERLSRIVVQAALTSELADAWQAWLRVVQRFGEWARNASLRELHLVTFDDMIRLAVELLEGHPAVRQRERQRLRALLVDEFQDTDPAQLRLIAALMRRESPEDHPVAGFFVGDLKQSIYRFRGADLGSIRHFCRRYSELAALPDQPETCQLTTCFRSLPPLVEFINRFFEDQVKLTRENERLVAFREQGSGSPEAPQWIQVCNAEEGAKLNAAQERRLLAWEAVDCVRSLQQQGFALGEISLLVRKEKELNPLLEALDEAGLAAVSSGARTFYRHPEVLDLLNLLIACHHPQDRLAAAAVLRSPTVDLDDRLIHRLVPAIQQGSLFHGDALLPKDLPDNARQRIEGIRRLARERCSMDTLRWLDEVRQTLPLDAYVRPYDREGRSLIRIDRLLSRFLSVAEAESPQPPLVWLIEQRQRADRGDAFDADLGEDVSAASESLDALRVLTVHKAKGLENRAVIVYGWQSVLEDMRGEFPGGRLPKLLNLLDCEGRTRIEFRLPFGPLEVETQGFQKGLQEERQKNRNEAMRLAYVAATRARDRLILLSVHPLRRTLPDNLQGFLNHADRQLKGAKHPSFSACQDTLQMRRSVPSRPRPSTSQHAEIPFEKNRYLELWKARQEAAQAPGRLWLSPTDAEHLAEGEWLEAEESEIGQPSPTEPGASDRETGMLVHRYLELYLDHPDFQPKLLDALTAHENRSEQARQRAAQILERFFGGLSCDGAGVPFRQRLQECRILARELPFYMKIDGRPWFGVIDLVLESGQSILGIDYKSAAQRSPLPASYALQQQIYPQALRRLYPDREVAFEFWWLGGANSGE